MSQWLKNENSESGQEGGQVRELHPSGRRLSDRGGSYGNDLSRQLVLDSYGDDQEVNLRDYWQILQRRKSIIFTFAGLVLLTTIIASMLITPTYRASLLIQIDRETSKVLNFQDVTPVEALNDKDFYQTQYELLKSHTLVKRAINELDLTHNPVFLKESEPSGLPALVSSLLDLLKDVEKKPGDSSNRWVEQFVDNLTIDPVKNSRLVRLHYDSTDPETASMVLNNYAENFISVNLERRFDASSYAKLFLEERLAKVKIRLEESEKKLVAFARDNEIFNIDERENIDTQKLRETNMALAKAEQHRMEVESVYKDMESTNTQQLIEVLDNPVIQKLKNTKVNLEAEYQEKLRVFKPAYPAMLQLSGQIEEMQRKIELEIENIKSALYSRYNSALENERLVQNKLNQVKESVLGLQDRSIKYNILKREVDTNRELYEGLLQRMKEVGVSGGISANNISIVDPAIIPERKHKPRIFLNILLALIVGIFGGVGLAFLLEHLDDTVKGPEALERLVKIPSLGVIPFEAGTDSDRGDVSLLVHTDPGSVLAEAYRSVRTSVMYSTSNGAPQIMLVTSPSPGEGKSTSALSIAIAFTQMGKRVLLVDTDLRNSSVHKIMGLSNVEGLSSFLTGNSEPVDVSRDTQIENLYVISSGPNTPNPAELLASERMNELLKYARNTFDYIILDGPPILGLADALVLSSLADGTIVVAEAGNTPIGGLKSSIKRLRHAHGRLIGGIITKAQMNYSGYGQYGSYYYYSKDEPNSKPSLPI